MRTNEKIHCIDPALRGSQNALTHTDLHFCTVNDVSVPHPATTAKSPVLVTWASRDYAFDVGKWFPNPCVY